jgi:membrane-associated protease RseP (regulator of RpoE activity)
MAIPSTSYTPVVDTELLTALVQRVFYVEDITHGSAQQNFMVRYRGRLALEDTASAYDQLAAALKPYNMTPLFRMDEGRHAVILVSGVITSRPSNPWVNVVLGVLTILSVLLSGALYGGTADPFLNGVTLPAIISFLAQGWPFALSLLGILGAHEFGHYLVGRYHGAKVTLPYFIPLPFISPFGTMGAFINMKEPPKNRRILLDIGIAGPLAGLVVAIPVLIFGLATSHLGVINIQPGYQYQQEGNSILYLLAKFFIFGQLLPHPVSFGSLGPVVYWIKYFFTGLPLPAGALDVQINMVAWAGWVGLLVTGLNLIPAGQLDGGHMLYVLLGAKRARRVLPFILGALVLLGFVWSGWWLWAALIFFLGRTYAEPLDQITALDRPRRLLAVLALIIFILVFMPIPLVIFGG